VELRDRLAKFCLELHPGKTRLIEFGRFALRDRQRRGEVGSPETFNFLGFTHICACNRKAGRYQVQRRTMRKRMTAKLHEVKTEMQRRRELPIADQGRWLAAVLRGHYAYYGVPTNYYALDAFRSSVVRNWYRSLRRRKPTIGPGLESDESGGRPLVAIGQHRTSLAQRPLSRHHPRQEPSAVVPHAGICAGAAQVRKGEGRPYRDQDTPTNV